MQAATLAVQGLVGSDVKAAIAAGSLPYLAEIIKDNMAKHYLPEIISSEA